jgi:hypothetical protein
MPAGPTSVFLAPNRWTQVEWIVGLPFFTASWTGPAGARISWRWYTSVPPFYWEGTFSGRACITYGPGLYTSLEMNPGGIGVTVVRGFC